MGRQARGMKCDKGIGGVVDKGPLPKAKRRIFEFVNHEIRKEDIAPRCTVVRLRGRSRKRIEIGRMAKNLVVPFGMNLAMV